MKWSFWSAPYGSYTPFFCKTIWKIQIYTSCCRWLPGKHGLELLEPHLCWFIGWDLVRTYHLGATIRTINGDNLGGSIRTSRIHGVIVKLFPCIYITHSMVKRLQYITCGMKIITNLFFSGEVKVTILDVLGPGYIITFMFVAMDVATTPGDMLGQCRKIAPPRDDPQWSRLRWKVVCGGFYGILMGLFMGFLWDCYGIFMGLFMGFLWDFDGFWWDCIGILMGLLWDFYGLFIFHRIGWW